MHLIIFCGSKMVWHALSVYLHHLCLIFLAGTDIVFQWPNLMRSRGDTSISAPREGPSQNKEEHVVYPPVQEEHVVYPPVQGETVTPWGEGSSSGWGRDLPLRTRLP